MTTLNNQTLTELTEVYNTLNPENPIKKFSCSKEKAIQRIEALQAQIKLVEPEVLEPEVLEPEVLEPEVLEPEVISDSIPMKVKTKDPDTIKFPELVVLTDMEVTGKTEDGELKTIIPESSLRMAGHMVDGKFLAVRSIKTDRYRETSHDFVFNTVKENLQSHGFEFGIWKTRFNAPHDHLVMDLVMNKQYKINESIFESDLGVTYNEADDERQGIYQPMIRLTNSFFSASKIEFALIRILCTNGMYRIADRLSISFTHLDRNILSVFEDKTNEFMSYIFERNWVEEFITHLSNMPLKSIETLMEWLFKYAGKKAALEAEAKFKLDSLSVQNKLNMWMVYNIVTWIATHCVQNLRREQTLFAKLRELN